MPRHQSGPGASPDIGLLVIDYLQLMSTGKRTENRVQEISEITRNLKIMAKELNVPVICTEHSSPASAEHSSNRTDHRPGAVRPSRFRFHRAGRGQ